MMYLRLVRLRVHEGQAAAYARFYQERVIPALAATEGCLYAALLSPWRSEAHQSLTLWSSPEHATAYERSGLYDELLAEGGPMLADRAEWRVRLARDPQETMPPDPPREPVSEGYSVATPEAAAALGEGDAGSGFVRIVVVRVTPESLADFVALYRDEVIPALERVNGCRGAFLAEGVHHPSEVLSITLWDREEDAVRYEMSREFERLAGRLAGTFTPVYGWQTRLGGTQAPGGLEVATYQVAKGRRLGPPGEGS
jgi:heme-degrading monooxygenase HmoA